VRGVPRRARPRRRRAASSISGSADSARNFASTSVGIARGRIPHRPRHRFPKRGRIEHLDRFARDVDLPHLEPWRRFNRRVRATGDVGIWHETYRVHAGEYEAIYGNMPVFGLAAAGEHVPVGRKANSAAARIGATDTDAPAVEPY